MVLRIWQVGHLLLFWDSTSINANGQFPNMHAYATERRNAWIQEEVEDYQKFEKLLTLFAFCFQWADLPSATPIIGHIANVVTYTAVEWRDMIEDKGDTSRLTCWEREIGQSSGSSFPTDLTPSS